MAQIELIPVADNDKEKPEIDYIRGQNEAKCYDPQAILCIT